MVADFFLNFFINIEIGFWLKTTNSDHKKNGLKSVSID